MFLSFVIRASVVLFLGLATVSLLHRRSAALRHAVLASAVCGALTIPLAGSVLPSWRLGFVLPSAGSASAPVVPTERASVQTTFRLADESVASQAVAEPPARRSGLVLPAIAMVWAVGAVVSGLVLLAGLGRLVLLSVRTRPLVEGRWVDELRSMADDGRLRRTELLSSGHPSLLFTWGFTRPHIVLPRGAGNWPAARIRVVLAHELEHIRRGDWLLQLLAEALRSLAWFNPLAWMVARRLRIESERACDDAVLARGIAAPEYAEHLVALARTLAVPRVWIPAPAMARASSLERRVTAMLDARVTRRPLTRVARAFLVVAGLTVAATVATFAQSNFATVNGTIHDQLGGTIPRVTLTITHPESGAKREIKSNAAGAFEFVGLPSGNYTMSALAMGFKPFEVPLQLTGGKTTRQDITLDVGTLQETITVRDGPPLPAAPRRPMSSSLPGACSAQPNSGGLMPPTKTHDTRPIYPTAYRGTDIEGRVSLKATIGVDGAVRTVQMVEATNADFDQAAQDAVRQWRFTPTLLNCVPVEVEMNVLTTFRPETAPPPPAR